MNVSPFSRSGLLVFITGLHLALLWAVFSIHQSRVKLPVPPTVVMAELLPMQAPPQPQPRVEPPPEPPKPVRKPEPRQTPKPVVRERTPAPLPTPNTTPSERAFSTPPAAPAPPVEAAPSAPPTPAAPATPAPISAPRFDAAYLNNPPPPYPRQAKRMGEQGRVTLRVHVTPEGLPSEVRLQSSSGSSQLDDVALETVRSKWKFVPAKQNGAPVAAWVIVPIDFKLD